jgi:hypothetical protein
MNKSIMTNNAIRYTIDQLFKIANPNKNIKYNISISENMRKTTLTFNENKKKIIFNLAGDNQWKYLIQGDINELKWIDNSRNTFKIPILFWSNKDLPFTTINDTDTIFNGDWIYVNTLDKNLGFLLISATIDNPNINAQGFLPEGEELKAS